MVAILEISYHVCAGLNKMLSLLSNAQPLHDRFQHSSQVCSSWIAGSGQQKTDDPSRFLEYFFTLENISFPHLCHLSLTEFGVLP